MIYLYEFVFTRGRMAVLDLSFENAVERLIRVDSDIHYNGKDLWYNHNNAPQEKISWEVKTVTPQIITWEML